jgi:3-deoxy-D-manno-octulosonic-acid transferase
VHLFFYNIFLLLYTVLLRIAALWNPKARRWVHGRIGIWDKLKSTAGNRPATTNHTRPATGGELQTSNSKLVWMHCASLGEFEQGRPVLEMIRAQYPGTKLLLTFFSPSGYEIRKDYPGADYIFYLPMDSKPNANRFLDIFQPTLVLWMKYEYWYYYLAALKKRNIPALLVSGIFRNNQPFFRWYGRLHRFMLECFAHLFVQTQHSKKLLGKIGFANTVTVSGDTRFDRVVTIAGQFEPIPLIEQFCGSSKVIVAGSTWIDDEEELDHYANTHPDIKFIIAPHEIDEEHLKEIEKLFKHTIRYSTLQAAPQTTPAPPQAGNYKQQTPNVLIIDNIGMLSKLYKYATITYVGGGFGDDGVHNVLEAAVYGKPVVFGPVFDKYIEAVELEESGGAITIDNALELEKTFDELLPGDTKYAESCAAARNYVYAKMGATNTIMEFIQEKRLLTN